GGEPAAVADPRRVVRLADHHPTHPTVHGGAPDGTATVAGRAGPAAGVRPVREPPRADGRGALLYGLLLEHRADHGPEPLGRRRPPAALPERSAGRPALVPV